MHEVSLLLAIKHSPTFFLLAIVLGLPSLLVAVIAIIATLKKVGAARALGVVASIGAVLTAMAAVVGWLLARAQVDAVLAMPALTESEKARLLAAGYAEAAYILWFGLAVAALPLLLGAAAAIRAKRT